MNTSQTLFVVDDDDAVRRALGSVGSLLEIPVKEFSSAIAFLSFITADHPGCVILDIMMPEMTGLELQNELTTRQIDIPIIMISGHADVRIAVETMSKGAITLLEKPFSLDELMRYVRRGLAADTEARQKRRVEKNVQDRISSLTPRERNVLDRIVAGQSNREIANDLNLSIRAIEDRRSRLMKKLGVERMAELMNLTLSANLPRP